MYTVIFHGAIFSSGELQVWLNEIYEKDGLELVTCNNDFYIFKKRPNTASSQTMSASPASDGSDNSRRAAE
jgi:hypothetical protein